MTDDEDAYAYLGLIMACAVEAAVREFSVKREVGEAFAAWWAMKLREDLATYEEYNLFQAWDEWTSLVHPLLKLES